MLAKHPTFANRQALISALRDETNRQCFNTFGDWDNPSGPVCFAGLAMRIHNQREGKTSQPAPRKLSVYYGFPDISDFLYLMNLNDQRTPFPKLADTLESTPLILEHTS